LSDPKGPALRWDLADRRLYLCTPDRPDLERFVAACLAGGVDIVQLREKHLPDDQLMQRATLVQRVCADHGVPFILNDRPDLAADMGADGVHVGQDDAPPETARAVVGANAIIGLSTHAPGELEAALGTGRGEPTGTHTAPVDYISAGPVVATPTKPGRPGTGLGYVTTAVGRAPWSVWVTGGVDPVTVVDMIGAGARHFVVVRWLTGATDPEANAKLLRRTIDEAIGRVDA
jgi:thiamine-phosphate pyrophosphorylase